MFQARRSLLVWKVFGKRTDGWSNDDFPTEAEPGNPKTLRLKGEAVPDTVANRNRADLDYVGGPMPPPEAVAGTYVGPDGKKVKVAPLTDEDRLTLVRWIDLGCPIDLDYDAAQPAAKIVARIARHAGRHSGRLAPVLARKRRAAARVRRVAAGNPSPAVPRRH